jgi:hypothetical protein
VPRRALRQGPGPVSVDSARLEWDSGVRRLAAESGDATRARHLWHLVEAVVGELRRRIGQTFTLAELADAYVASDLWVREVVEDATPPRASAGIRDAALVQDAAFGHYARGAIDYSP